MSLRRSPSIYALVAAFFILGGAMGAIPGSRLSARIDEQRLRQGFAGLITLVAVSMFASTVLGGLQAP